MSPLQHTQLPAATLDDALDSELDQLLVCGALVVREGSHYRLESGLESWDELQAAARRLEGICDCGAPLSRRGDAAICRTCCREFQV
jgi:hypothetical protein